MAVAKRQGDQGLRRSSLHCFLFLVASVVPVCVSRPSRAWLRIGFCGSELIRLPFHTVSSGQPVTPLLLPFHAAEAVLVAASFQSVEQLCNTFYDAPLMTMRGPRGDGNNQLTQGALLELPVAPVASTPHAAFHVANKGQVWYLDPSLPPCLLGIVGTPQRVAPHASARQVADSRRLMSAAVVACWSMEISRAGIDLSLHTTPTLLFTSPRSPPAAVPAHDRQTRRCSYVFTAGQHPSFHSWRGIEVQRPPPATPGHARPPLAPARSTQRGVTSIAMS